MGVFEKPRESPLLLIFCVALICLESSQGRVRSGSCQEGVSYRIESVSDLESHGDELDCVFMSGLPPNDIPMGTWRMRMLQILDTRGLNPVLNTIAPGKYASRFRCSGNTSATMLWNNVLGNPIMPGILRLGSLNEYNLEEGIYQDSKNSVLIDYGDDLGSKCAEYDFVNFLTHGQSQGDPSLITTKQITKNYFPLNQNIGGLRFVGRGEDGTGIYLGKMFMRNLNTGRFGFLAYFSTLNKDKSVCSDFKHGDTLPPLESGFSYKYNRTWRTIGRVLPWNRRQGGALFREIGGNFKLWQKYSQVRRNPGYDGPQVRKEFLKTFNMDYAGNQPN